MGSLSTPPLNQPKRLTIAPTITISADQHNKLVEYIKDRLEFGNWLRNSITERYALIDSEIAGYIRLTPEQQEKKQRQARDGIPRPTRTNLQLTAAQIDEAVTVSLSMLSPENEMYKALAPKESMEVAKAFSTLMNQHAEDFSHYSTLARSIRDCFTYNWGGVLTLWKQVQGPVFDTNAQGPENTFTYGVTNQGNCLTPLDPYNTIWDISVPPCEVSSRGEFFALADATTRFNLKRMAASNPPQVFNVDYWIDQSAPLTTFTKGTSVTRDTSWYRPRPIVRDAGTTAAQDWINVFTTGTLSNPDSTAVELVHTYIWIRPKDFGLSPATDIQTWYIVMANNKHLVWAQHLDYAHGQLPCAISQPWDDGFTTDSKSIAEQLLPLQTYASHELNVRQASATRSLFGVGFYNKAALPEIRPEDMQNGMIPVTQTFLQNGRIQDSVMFHQHRPIDDTWQNIDASETLMQKLYPTSQTTQVADLERATQYQAAATVQGINRRGLKFAKIINDQMMHDIRNQQMWNIFRFQEAMEIVLPDGTAVPINPADFRETKLRFSISDGLKGIDRLQITIAMQTLIQAIIQNPTVNAQINMVDLLDYFTDLVGDTFDFKSFKIESQIDNLPPDQRDLAFQLLQQFIAQQEGQGTGQASPPAREAPLQLPIQPIQGAA